jgi:chromosome partitioning protein
MITLFGGLKGGSGKSTTSINVAAELAAQGKDVLLVDGNALQGTASNWAARREQNDKLPQITCIEKSGNLYKALIDLSDKYDEVIVDTGGQDSKEFRTALLAADLVVTPIAPTQPDAETLVFVSDLIEQAREINESLDAAILVTKAPANPAITVVSETRELVSGLHNMRLLDSVIFNRKAYSDSFPGGQSAGEIGNKKAADEIRRLVEEIYGGQ